MNLTNTTLLSGVKTQKLKKIINDRGGLLEIQRNDQAIFPGFGQTYVTTTYSGIIKAWYYHHKQIDQLIVLKGSMKLVLYDARSHSPTYQQINEIIIHDHAPELVQFPPGIWHGFQSIGASELLLLHLNSAAFKEEGPD